MGSSNPEPDLNHLGWFASIDRDTKDTTYLYHILLKNWKMDNVMINDAIELCRLTQSLPLKLDKIWIWFPIICNLDIPIPLQIIWLLLYFVLLCLPPPPHSLNIINFHIGSPEPQDRGGGGRKRFPPRFTRIWKRLKKVTQTSA